MNFYHVTALMQRTV